MLVIKKTTFFQSYRISCLVQLLRNRFLGFMKFCISLFNLYNLVLYTPFTPSLFSFPPPVFSSLFTPPPPPVYPHPQPPPCQFTTTAIRIRPPLWGVIYWQTLGEGGLCFISPPRPSPVYPLPPPQLILQKCIDYNPL